MNEQPTHLDLFSGIGGFALAAGWAGFKTIGFCEIDKFCQGALKKHWPEVPIHENIKELRGGGYRGCTLLTGGFPCQPFSQAGKRRGKDDDRYLWPEMLRVIREARPAWIVGENVAGIVNMALDQVHTDLEAEGYEVESLIVPACAVDAPHRRDRVWIIARHLANAVSLPARGAYRREERTCIGGRKDSHFGKRDEVGGNIADGGEDVADAKRIRLECSRNENGMGEAKKTTIKEKYKSTFTLKVAGSSSGAEGRKWRPLEGNWNPEPNVGRVAHGIPNRVAKLRGLGNAIVPQVAYQILKGIRELV